MWTVTLAHSDGTVTSASSVTRQDARNWARQYRAAGDTVAIVAPFDPYALPAGEWDRLVALASADGGDAPCSRYGTRVASFAPYAVAAHLVFLAYNGADDDEVASLDGMLSLVVNDSPGPAETIVDGWHTLPHAVRRELGGIAHVRALARD